MIALFSREFVNLPLLCGTAEHTPRWLWPSNQRSPSFRSQLWRFLLLSQMIYCMSRPNVLLFLSPFYSQLGQRSAFFYNPAVWSCPLPSSFLDPPGQRPAPLCGPVPVVTTPHCVLPQAIDRTRCRLMASSRNPATFSLSSFRENTACLGQETTGFPFER